MSGFTPGPWSIVETPYATGTRKHVVNERRVGIAILDASSNKRTTEANANLIAAAPMLFDACEDALAAFKLLVAGLSHDRAVVDMIKPHIDELEYALAKARGETVKIATEVGRG